MTVTGAMQRGQTRRPSGSSADPPGASEAFRRREPPGDLVFPLSISHVDVHGSGSNAVGYDLKFAQTRLLVGRYVEPDPIDLVGGNRHRAGVVRSTVLHVPSLDIRDAHQWEICCRLCVVSVERALRDSIKAEAVGLIGSAWAHGSRYGQHDRNRSESGPPR